MSFTVGFKCTTQKCRCVVATSAKSDYSVRLHGRSTHDILRRAMVATKWVAGDAMSLSSTPVPELMSGVELHEFESGLWDILEWIHDSRELLDRAMVRLYQDHNSCEELERVLLPWYKSICFLTLSYPAVDSSSTEVHRIVSVGNQL